MLLDVWVCVPICHMLTISKLSGTHFFCLKKQTSVWINHSIPEWNSFHVKHTLIQHWKINQKSIEPKFIFISSSDTLSSCYYFALNLKQMNSTDSRWKISKTAESSVKAIDISLWIWSSFSPIGNQRIDNLFFPIKLKKKTTTKDKNEIH